MVVPVRRLVLRLASDHGRSGHRGWPRRRIRLEDSVGSLGRRARYVGCYSGLARIYRVQTLLYDV